MLKYLAGVCAAAAALWPATASAAPAWEQWQSVAGVFDVSGPRANGSLLVAGSAALYTLTPDGTLSPFANGPGGYHDDPSTEAYLAVSPGLSAGRGCGFPRDVTYVIRLHAPVGITSVSEDGSAIGSFASVDAPSLNGIAFDTTGHFGRGLIVTGPVSGRTEVASIDCTGHVQVITKTAPVLEGGIAVAPESFGAFGGDLIAPDELSGVIWAIAPDGSATQVVASGLAHGQDIGVESVGFVPAGFASRGGFVYEADRGTAHVLRLASADLVAAGVQDGDLLAATEGGASMVDVRCGASCQVVTVVPAPTTAHGEGHLVFAVTAPPPSPSTSAPPSPLTARRGAPGLGPLELTVAVVVVAVIVAAGIAVFYVVRSGPARRG